MRSGGNDFNDFLENKLTKLANFVQFKRMLMFSLEDWVPPPLARPLIGLQCRRNLSKNSHRESTDFELHRLKGYIQSPEILFEVLIYRCSTVNCFCLHLFCLSIVCHYFVILFFIVLMVASVDGRLLFLVTCQCSRLLLLKLLFDVLLG